MNELEQLTGMKYPQDHPYVVEILGDDYNAFLEKTSFKDGDNESFIKNFKSYLEEKESRQKW